MEQETKPPEGLGLAETLCGHAFCADACTEDQMRAAVDAIRDEHTQRMTLQHHAVDLAQRVADLEAQRDEWQRIASAYSPAKELATSLKQAKASGDAARKERDELRTRLAELEQQEPVAWLAPAEVLGVEYLPPTDEDEDQEAYSALMRVGGAIQALVLAANGLETK